MKLLFYLLFKFFNYRLHPWTHVLVVSGGNNIFVSNGSGTVTSKNSGLSGALNLISTQTASGASSVSFTSGLDSTYDVYVFKDALLQLIRHAISFFVFCLFVGSALFALAH